MIGIVDIYTTPEEHPADKVCFACRRLLRTKTASGHRSAEKMRKLWPFQGGFAGERH